MARLSVAVVLFGLLSVTRVAAQLSQTDLDTENQNADCDNGCFFGSFNGSCANDPACMCDQQAYREAYFCCMGHKCAPSVLPDSIARQDYQCGLRNMPFTFDAEAVCGIKLTVPSSSAASPAPETTVSAVPAGTTSTGGVSLAVSSSTTVSAATTASHSTSSTASASTTAALSTSTSSPSSTKSQSSSGGATSTPKTNSAPLPVKRLTLNNIAILVAAFGMSLL